MAAFKDQDNQSASFHLDDPLCFSKLGNSIYEYMLTMNPDFFRDMVYLCIGTDRATGDCLGPLVGTRLGTLCPAAIVYGTLEEPAHANNLAGIIDKINCHYRSPLIIAIDACLGSFDRVGYINIKKGSLKPGTALKKILPEVGDFYISGVVNVGGFLEHLVLQNTRLHLVYRMANTIAKGLYLAQNRFMRNKTQDYSLSRGY